MEIATSGAAAPSGLADWCVDRSIPLCVLYGSRSTGGARGDSDWDVAVWTEAPAPEARLRWLAELSRLFDGEVELVFATPALDPILGLQIVRQGEVLHADDPERWPAERARLWHRFNDSLPFRRAERERLRAFAEEVRAGA